MEEKREEARSAGEHKGGSCVRGGGGGMTAQGRPAGKRRGPNRGGSCATWAAVQGHEPQHLLVTIFRVSRLATPGDRSTCMHEVCRSCQRCDAGHYVLPASHVSPQ